MQELSENDKLARVALHYGLIPDTQDLVQKVVCPIHEDVNPSMSINLEAGFCYCYGCGFRGDAQKLAVAIERKYHGVGELQALINYNHALTSTKAKPIRMVPRTRSKAISRENYAIAYDYYHGLSNVPWTQSERLVQEAQAALAYMQERGFEARTLELADARVTYRDPYQLIFPMKDNGTFKGWVSRTMDPEVAKRRKYLYNRGFSRATTLVGNYANESYVFVVEGYMDRLKLLQLGLSNVVAILGWKMSAQQIAKLKEHGIERVIATTDNDEAGRRGVAWLRQNFKVTRWRYLRGLKDPGDFTPESFNKMYRRTMQEFEKGK